MKYEIYQVLITELEVNLINANGRDKAAEMSPVVNAYMLSTLDRDYQKAWDTGEYTKVAVIDAEDLNDVFRIGNIGPEENIERLERMHSVSVGDVIKDSDGNLVAVASCGFDSLK